MYAHMFKLLAAAIERACAAGDMGSVVRAKRLLGYSYEDIETLSLQNKRIHVRSAELAAYETYIRLTSYPEYAVKQLTGHAPTFWRLTHGH